MNSVNPAKLRGVFLRFRSRLRDNRDYAKSLASQYIFMGTHVAVQILLVPLYLHKLGEFQFGVLMVLLAFVNYTAVGLNWMTGGVLRLLGEAVAHKDEEGLHQTYALAKWLYVGYSAILTAAGLLLVFTVPGRLIDAVPLEYQDSVANSVILLGAYLIVFYDLCVDRMVFIASGKLYLSNILQTVALVAFASGAVPVLLLGGRLHDVVTCLLLGVILARIGAWWIRRRERVHIGWKVPKKADWPLLRRLVGRMGLGFFLYGIILLTMQADTILVSLLGGVTLAAEFVLVWKIAEVAIQIIWRIPETLVPNLIQLDAKRDSERLRSLIHASAQWSIVVSLITGIVYAVGGSTIVELWVGEEHAPHNPLGYALAGLVIVLMGSSHTHAMFAYATLRLKELIKVSGVELLLKLALTVALFPFVGYLAPMIGFIVVRIGGVQFAYRNLTRRALAV